MYTEKFGFKVHTDAAFEGMRWLTICPANQSDFEIALMKPEDKLEESLLGKQAGKKPYITFESNDIKKDYAEMSKKGVKFHGEPKEEPWGTAVACQDLDGNMLYICQPNK